MKNRPEGPVAWNRVIKAEILSIGDELLSAGVREENSLFLGQEVSRLGCVVLWKTIVGDLQKNIEDALREAIKRASVVVITGGLGSAEDDLTRKAVSQVTGRRLILNERLLKQLERRIREGAKTAKKADSRLALVPSRARILSSSDRSVHGFALHVEEAYLICLPGTPYETRRIFNDAARTYLNERLKPRPLIRLRTLRTAGIEMPEVRERLDDLIRFRGPVKIRARGGWSGVDVDLYSPGRTARAAEELLIPVTDKIMERLGESVYGQDEETLEMAVGQLLKSRGLTLSVAESCTGGLIGHRLTNVPGSSGYLERVCVCYSDRCKVEMLGVPGALINEHGSVSSPTAAAMATAVRDSSSSDLGLSVTGIAGPSGGTPQKPVGLVFFGLASKEGVEAISSRFYGDRKAVKRQASQMALDHLRRYLLSTR